MAHLLRAPLGAPRRSHPLLLVYVVLTALVLFACSSSPRSADSGFVSDNPDLGNDYYGGDGGTGGGSNGGSGGSGGSGATGGESPERAIEEADIVQTAGNRLYALSRYGGLSVIDVGTQDRLDLLGRFKTDATPFEMYLRGNVVLALFDSYSFGEYNSEGYWEWNESSRVLALDVSNPSDVRLLSETQLPGTISDSRIVGDVLYVVSHENGYCWHCGDAPRTTVTSLDIANAAQTTQVDRLAFNDTQDDWGWSRRSITVTDQRMYVAGRDYDSTWGSKIQIVDISDPSGDMRLGIALRAAGEIESRWQMDETNGVLRVISQPGLWATTDPPELQTFAIESSNAATHLATLPVQLPKPERLRSVRFDGDRAFAITAEQTDPLFTFDLSDPAAPKQLGELEMPGWVYHMEPRGNRLLALGYDNSASEGSLHVSLFDVSDLSSPKLLSRSNFGGEWAYLPEDQDRIHKAFKLLEPEGLILVPYSGWGDPGGEECDHYVSGVQLIDWGSDSLERRGVAPSVGDARRAWVMNQRLFTVSDDRVESFDFSDRDNSARTAGVSIARQVNQTALAGDNLVRLGGNWWSSSTLLDVVPPGDASNPAPLGEIQIDTASCSYGGGQVNLFTHGSLAYLWFNDYDYYDNVGQSSTLAVIDVANPAEPKLLSQRSLQPGSGYWWYYGLNGVVPSGAAAASLGSTFAVLHSSVDFSYDDVPTEVRLEVIDLADPTKPSSSLLDLGSVRGQTGLIAHAGALYASHYEPTSDGRARFYVDRIDVSDPAHPKHTKVNVPGSLLGIDPSTGKALTVSYHRHSERLNNDYECYERHGYAAHFDYDAEVYSSPGTCTWLSRELKLVTLSGAVAVESTLPLLDTQYPSRIAMADGVFISTLEDVYNYNSTATLHTISGFAAGKLELGSIELKTDDPYPYVSQVVAKDDHVAVLSGQSVVILDAKNPEALKVTQTQRFTTYPGSVSLSDTQAFVSLGYDGVAMLSLESE